jgi:hypothetical protein
MSTDVKDDAERKGYTPPAVTRVKLEDRRVVAMAVCKDGVDGACTVETVPAFQLNAS